MRLLPICINNNVNYMVDFESRRFSDTFIVTADTPGTLFKFATTKCPDTGCECVLLQEVDGVNSYYLRGVDFQSEENNDFTITFTFSSNQNERLRENAEYEGYVFNINTMSLNYPIVNDAKIVEVKFVLGKQERSIKMYQSPSGQVRDVVIDSGSEATQYAMFKRDANVNNVNYIQEILTNVIRHFKGAAADGNSRDEYALKCIQAEVNGNVFDKTLFKSQFFVRKEVGKNVITQDTILPTADGSREEGLDSVLRMLTTKEELNDITKSHIQLCNTKISTFGGIRLPNINVNGMPVSLIDIAPENYFYRRYMSVFIYGILENFCHEMNQENLGEINRAKFLSLYVLMPNVYSCEDIQSHVDHIITDTKKMIDNNERFKEFVKGFSVVPVSESDASLIGAKSMQVGHAEGSGTYLIIDAGKGTLDFSITEMDDQGNFNNLFKSGIVGASAAISYGFLLDLLKEFFAEKDITVDDRYMKEFIFGNILGKTERGMSLEGGDVYLLNELMKAVDSYKIRYSSLSPYRKESTASADSSSNDEIRLSTFINWIEQRKVQVPTDNVNAIIGTITNYFITKLTVSNNITNINYVMFSGRGFLYKDFKNYVLNTLKGVFGEIEEVNFLGDNTGVTNKNICLFITSVINSGMYNFQYMPKPYEIDEKYVTRLREIRESRYVMTGNVTTQSRWVRTLLEEWARRRTMSQQRQVIAVSNCSFEHGYDVACAPNSHIAIAGSHYKLPQNCACGVATIFYNNGQLDVRYADRYGQMQVSRLERISDLDAGLAFPSLFPFTLIYNSDDIYLPNIEERNDSADQASQSNNISDVTNDNNTDKEEVVVIKTEDNNPQTDVKETEDKGNYNTDNLNYFN